MPKANQKAKNEKQTDDEQKPTYEELEAYCNALVAHNRILAEGVQKMARVAEGAGQEMVDRARECLELIQGRLDKATKPPKEAENEAEEAQTPE